LHHLWVENPEQAGSQAYYSQLGKVGRLQAPMEGSSLLPLRALSNSSPQASTRSGVLSDRDRVLLEPNLGRRTSDWWILEVNTPEGSLAELLKERGASFDGDMVSFVIYSLAGVGSVFFVYMTLHPPSYVLETFSPFFWSFLFDAANLPHGRSLATC